MAYAANPFGEITASDVVVTIAASGAMEDGNKGGHAVQSSSIPQATYGFKSPERVTKDADDNQMSSENTMLSPSRTRRPPSTPNKPPKRRAPAARLAFSKPKSRLVEPPYPSDVGSAAEESTAAVGTTSPYTSSSNKIPARVSASSPKTIFIVPKTPFGGYQGGEDDDDDEVYITTLQMTQRSGNKLKLSVWLEWTVFVGLMALMFASLTVDQIKVVTVWSLGLWKWCVLATVIFCGRLVTRWFINVLVFFIERNFLLKKKVLYFVYGVRRSVRIFLWLSFTLLAWGLLFTHGVQRSRKTNKTLHRMTVALGGCVVGAALWLVKTLLIKSLAVNFHVRRFFDRIQESLFHQYILRVLSGPPLMEMEEKVGSSTPSGRLSFGQLVKRRKAKREEMIDIEKLKKMKQEKVSAWTMRGLIKVITGTWLSTIPRDLDNDTDDEGADLGNNDITSEWEAKTAAYQIFKNIAQPGHKYIEEEDLLCFMKREEADHVFPLFEGATETGKIKKSALTKWVVDAYLERKSLAHSLNDTRTAVEELNKIASGIALVMIAVVWNLMMGFLTTKILVFISSQLLLVGFMFGNTAKTVFEAIIFVFVMHPFDVGDRCVIDGVQMVVEEMNILTTIFLRYDNEKIIYPNSVLATKPISNFYRSPEMSDAVEFTVDFSTSIETISDLEARIKAYIESKPQHWRSSHALQFREIENMNKMKLGLYVNHTINFQNAGERSSRRSDLVMELKKALEELGIKYHLLPQEVHVTYVGSPASPIMARC